MKRIILIILSIIIIANVANGHKLNENPDTLNIIVRKFISDGSCSVYIISSSKGNILIDPGHYDKKVKDYIVSLGGIDGIILTHGHWDHIRALDKVKKDYPNIKVYINELDKDFLYNSELSRSGKSANILKTKDITTINEGKIKIGDYDIEVMHTPGHSRGSSIFWFKEENILFSGDFIFEKSIGRMDFLTGSESDMKNSIEKFKKIDFPGNMMIYSGHGNSPFSYIALMRDNSYLNK